MNITLHLSATRPASGHCLVCGVRLTTQRGEWWLRNTWTEKVELFTAGGSASPNEDLVPCGPAPSKGPAA